MGEIEETEGDDSWSLLCLKCFGDGCDECGGFPIEQEGKLSDYFDGKINLMYSEISYLNSHHIFPTDGGLDSQSAKFLDCDNYVARVKVGYQTIKRNMAKNER